MQYLLTINKPFKIKIMKIFLIVIAVLFAIFFAFSQNENVKKEVYVLIKKIDEVEIRAYNESINASYYSKSESERNSYFKYLASYIFGGNSENKKISMTSPVTMRLHGNKEMIFRMPDKYTLDNLPDPNNTNINFFKIPPCIKATITYGGYSNKKIEQKKIQKLSKLLLENNIHHNNKFEVLVYNSPYKIINRRNEITVNIIFH